LPRGVQDQELSAVVGAAAHAAALTQLYASDIRRRRGAANLGAGRSARQSQERIMFSRQLLLGVVLGAAVTLGAGAFATDAMTHGFGHHGMHAKGLAPGELDAHVDKALQHLYVDIEATDAQKAQIGPLVKQACDDLMPLHDSVHGAHAEALALLRADNFDRTALETMRTRHVQEVDVASRRLAQLVGDVAATLTPAQRQLLADHIARHHG
jgi:Spy/CpxP family protein refolding chaperone